MVETKLVHILKTFSRSEMGRWRDFVKSPYYNKNKYVLALAQFLEKRYPKFNPAKTTKEKAFDFIFPRKKYDDLRLRHLLSVLLKVTEEFLAAQHLRHHDVSKGVKLMGAFKKRNLAKHFEAAHRQTTKRQNNHRQVDIFYHYHQYRIEMEREQFLDMKEGRRKVTGLQKVSDHLDAFYLINKLKQCCAAISQQNVFGQQFQLKMLDEVLSHLKNNSYDIPLLHLYQCGLLTLMEPENETHFFALKENLSKHLASIPREEAAELHVLARNYCIKRLNTGGDKYVKELFDLYKLGLNSVVLDDKGMITPASFKNIIAVGLKLKEYNWTEKFIREYSQKLEEQYQGDYLDYNLAKLYFEKKDYGRVIEMIREVDFIDIFIAVDARTLLIKTYFEIDEYEILDSQLDSFRQFVQRKKEVAYHRKNYLNTIRFTRQLMGLKSGDHKQAERIRKKIEQEKMITEKSWMLEKLNELSA